MRDHLVILGLLVAVLVTPLLLRPRGEGGYPDTTRSLVIVTPHNEAIRAEFGGAFEEHHRAATGERIRVEWRTPGGTSEIGRYLAGGYQASFQYYWERQPGRAWNGILEKAFDNPKVVIDDSPADDTPEQAVRRAFLESPVGCGIDLFFGGGAFDFGAQAGAGRLVPSGVRAAHPELFGPDGIPATLSGEPFYDAKDRWVGTCLGSFGICYNPDALRRLGIPDAPLRWSDLGDGRYRGEIALANPTQSSSVNRAFEMLIQEQMQERWRALGGTPDSEKQAVEEGWLAALRLLQRIGANARYFTDASSKVALDVSAGDAAAGMTIDFFGRYQSESVRKPDGSSRILYVEAAGGSSTGADPIGLLRGAPQRELAKAFIGWVLSPGGQQLWNGKVGSPGGPRRYSLRRLPILPAAYSPALLESRSDPEVNPYRDASNFMYRESWTGPMFQPIALIVRAMCIDPHDELKAAWAAICAAGEPPQAMAALHDLTPIRYPQASAFTKSALGGRKIREVQLTKELSDHFRKRYREAQRLANAGL